MKNFYLFGMAALMGAAMTFSSCSNDDDVALPAGNNDGTISFAAVSQGVTRALATTPANYLTQVKDFRVWGYNASTSNYYMGAAGEGGLYIDGDGTGKWSHRTATDVHFWPSAALNFYAITPASNTGYSFNDTQLTYTVPTDNASQVDFMVAHADNQTKDTNSGVVTLPFKHSLSQIVFAAKTASSDMSVEISGITVHNVSNSVTVDLKDASVAATVGSNYSDYAVGLASAVTAASTTTAVSATDANGALLLVPQTITGWADGTTTTQANASHEGYLEITCKVKSGEEYLLGDAVDYGRTYVAFPATWEAGKKYSYTLVFGGTDGDGIGKKGDGTSQTTPITFTVTVDDWDSASSDVAL